MHCIILRCAVWKFPPFLTGVLQLSLQALKCLGLAIHNNLGPGVSSFFVYVYKNVKCFSQNLNENIKVHNNPNLLLGHLIKIS